MRHAVRPLSSCWYAVAAFTALCGLTGNSAYAQIAAAGTTSAAQTKSLSFEVASIRPSREGEAHNEQLLPDGFLLTNGSVRTLIGLVLDPTRILDGTRLRSAPNWVLTDRFDVIAKVSTEEAADWQRETTSGFESPAFTHALQHLLVERFKLQTHTVPIEVEGYALVLDRSGSKTKLVPADKMLAHDSAKSARENGPSMTVPEQGVVKFHNQPLSELAFFISNLSPYIVEDRTGLTGRYDFSISDRLPVHPTAEESEDLMLPDERWDLQPLGLKLVRLKVHTTALIIDHIEKPSPN